MTQPFHDEYNLDAPPVIATVHAGEGEMHVGRALVMLFVALGIFAGAMYLMERHGRTVDLSTLVEESEPAR